MHGGSAPPLRPSPTIFGIQLLRAVAATAVVAAHVRYDFIVHLNLPDRLPRALEWGNAGVDLFFVISGFVMVYSSERMFGQPGAAREFLTRRIARIVPLYWLMSLVMLAYVAARGFAASDASPAQALASFLFVPYPRPSGEVDPLYGVGWTLNYEMFFYAAFAVAIAARRGVAVAGLGAVLAMLVVANHACGGLPGPLSYWGRPIVLEFVLGMGIAVAHRAGVRLSTPAALALLAAAAVEFAIWASFDDALGQRWLSAGLPAAQAVTALALLRRDVVIGWVDRVGDASYALYLTHPVVIALARVLAQKGHLSPQAAPYRYLAGVVAASIVLSLLTHRLVERPLTSLARRALSRRGRHQGTMPPRGVSQA